MTDQDDPWTISKFFQQQYGLANDATAALFDLLQNNFDSEMKKRQLKDNIEPQQSHAESDQDDYPISTQQQTQYAISEQIEDSSSDDDNCDIESGQEEADRSRF